MGVHEAFAAIWIFAGIFAGLCGAPPDPWALVWGSGACICVFYVTTGPKQK